jgi:hypothetical protein
MGKKFASETGCNFVNRLKLIFSTPGYKLWCCGGPNALITMAT